MRENKKLIFLKDNEVASFAVKGQIKPKTPKSISLSNITLMIKKH